MDHARYQQSMSLCDVPDAQSLFPIHEQQCLCDSFLHHLHGGWLLIILAQSFRVNRWVGVSWHDLCFIFDRRWQDVLASFVPRFFGVETRVPDFNQPYELNLDEFRIVRRRLDGLAIFEKHVGHAPSHLFRAVRDSIQEGYLTVHHGPYEDFICPTNKLIAELPLRQDIAT